MRRCSAAPPARPGPTSLIELGSTLLSVYRTRGDLLRARHFASELLSAAELLGTLRAIVAASWNAAFVAQETGRGEEGMSLLERAMAIQSENGDHRNLAPPARGLRHHDRANPAPTTSRPRVTC